LIYIVDNLKLTTIGCHSERSEEPLDSKYSG